MKPPKITVLPALSGSAESWGASSGGLADASQLLGETSHIPLLPLLDAMPGMVLLLNSSRKIIFANQRVRDFVAATSQEAPEGRPLGNLFTCRNDAAAIHGCGTHPDCATCGALAAIIASLDGRAANKECRISRTNGTSLDLRVCATPLIFNQQSLSLVTAQDISHEKRRLVLERIFFHDIQNSAGLIANIIDLICDGTVSIDEMKDDLQTVSRTLLDEIQSQRVLVAAENDQLVVSLTPCVPSDLLTRIANPMRSHEVCREKNISIVPPEDDRPFLTDFALLHRVLANLLKNALEAVREGATVELSIRRPNDGTIEFICENPGVIPGHIQSQLFQRSFSTKGNGRGIGTYSIRLLTERYLKGSVSHRSDHDRQRTIFTVSLPDQSEN